MSVATALAALYAKYTADAASLTAGTLDYLKAIELIERWYAVAQQESTREASGIQSYSVAERSVTYAAGGSGGGSSGPSTAALLRAEVEAFLYGRGMIGVDLRGSDIIPNP